MPVNPHVPDEGLFFALRLDGSGGGTFFGWDEVNVWRPGDPPIWIHLDRHADETLHWLEDRSGLDALSVEALLAEETRPRHSTVGQGRNLLFLREVNLNPGEAPEDMISLRCWVEEGRLITLRGKRVQAVHDMRVALAQGQGPSTVGDLVSDIAERLTDRIAPFVDNLEDRIDALEERIFGRDLVDDADGEIHRALNTVRRVASSLRRYIAPQREALRHVAAQTSPWMSAEDQRQFLETSERVSRLVEDLDAIRDQATLLNEEMLHRHNERMGRTMFLLSSVAGLFLPLTFITGLLGINVDGIPGAHTPWAFWAVVVLCCGLLGVILMLFRRLKWL